MSADFWLELDDDEGTRLDDLASCPDNCEAISYDSLLVRAAARIEPHAWNLTYNLSPMIYAAGLPSWGEQLGQTAGDVAPAVARAVAELVGDRDRFEPMQPVNGWGTYLGAVEVLSAYSVALVKHPTRKVGGWL